MARPRFTHCVGSPAFKPDDLIQDAERQKQATELLAKDDLYGASKALLSLPEPDTYTYHAMTSVKLAEVQRIVAMGGVNGLHNWYRQEDGSPVRPFPPSPPNSLSASAGAEESIVCCRGIPRQGPMLTPTSPSSAPRR